MTPIKKMSEFIKINLDPIYFIETCVKIHSKTEDKMVPFILNEKQKIIVKSLVSNRFNIIKHGRQLGGTTLGMAILSYKIFITSNDDAKNILLLSYRRDLSIINLDILINILNGIPEYLWSGESYKGPFRKEKMNEFILPNGSKIKATCISKDVFRGANYSDVYIDNCAYINNIGQTLSSLIPMLSSNGGSLTLFSTPNGKDGFFYPTYITANNVNSNFVSNSLTWYEDYRFNGNLKWELNGNIEDEVLYTVNSFNTKINSGWTPTNEWYVLMKKNLHTKVVTGELDSKFE